MRRQKGRHKNILFFGYVLDIIKAGRQHPDRRDWMEAAKRTVRDSVFSDLFQDKKYLLKLYQALHPEDTDTTEDDLVDVTIQNVLTDGLYNDLGFRNKDRVVILAEAQSIWSVNIVLRVLLYLAQIWNEYIEVTKQNRYGSRKLKLPEPEMYVIFTGTRQERPEYLSLSDEFFGGKKGFLDVRVKMLYGGGEDDIISQYVVFTKVYQEQARLHGRTKEAILETIRICKDRGVLREYLSSREKEVVSIMMALFDQEKAVEQFGYEKMQEGHKEGRKEGDLSRARKTASNMLRDGDPIDKIARVLELPVDTIRSWSEEASAPA